MPAAADTIPPGINEVPDPNAFAAPPGESPQRRKRRKIEEPGSLTITSLMDVMTIILVFLIKSYTTNPVALKQAKDLKMPFSTSDMQPDVSTALVVTLNNIIVDDSPVLSIENGKVADSELSHNGMLIERLFQKLQEAVDFQKKLAQRNPQAKFNELVTVMSDRHVPFKLITQVMYTAGQAQFSKFKFAVVKGARDGKK